MDARNRSSWQPVDPDYLELVASTQGASPWSEESARKFPLSLLAAPDAATSSVRCSSHPEPESAAPAELQQWTSGNIHMLCHVHPGFRWKRDLGFTDHAREVHPDRLATLVLPSFG